MKISNTYEIVPDQVCIGEAALVVRVFVDGECLGGCVVVQGPIDDLRDLVSERASLRTLRKRWGLPEVH